MTGNVVVGVDGSEHSLAAVDLAADEAEHRGMTLELLHAFVLPVFSTPAGFATPAALSPPLPPSSPAAELGAPELRAHAEQLLSDAAARVRETHPDLPVLSRLRDGPPGAVLTDASHQASLVVVGHRGTGGFAALLAGAVGVQLANHAACPVIVVRGTPVADAPVVVGVDGSEGALRAAEFAARAAGWYGVSLLALYAWPVDPGWPPELAQSGYPPPTVPDPVAETLTGLAERFPRVPLIREFRQQVPAHEALVAASRHARLVVVGARGLGGFRGLLLGSVSQALIHHTECPVAVVGPEAT